MPEWLGSGLQNRVRRFNSGSGLQKIEESMSKKSKNKFRRRIKAQILEEMAHAQAPVSAEPVAQPQSPYLSARNLPSQETSQLMAPRKPEESLDSLTYTKKDLKKSAIIIGSIIILIITLSVIDTKINFLIKAGDEVFRILNISS